jgi:hypothetical protein
MFLHGRVRHDERLRDIPNRRRLVEEASVEDRPAELYEDFPFTTSELRRSV